jgi:hypothetical protein
VKGDHPLARDNMVEKRSKSSKQSPAERKGNPLKPSQHNVDKPPRFIAMKRRLFSVFI